MALIPVSWGEIIDKITILKIKSQRLIDVQQLKNVRHELGLLEAIRDKVFLNHLGLAKLSQALEDVNIALWVIEDEIRGQERVKTFGAKFFELARAVYVTNDKRSEIKRQINDLLGSDLIEEKSYAPY